MGNYNSLKDQLIRNGILPSNNADGSQNFFEFSIESNTTPDTKEEIRQNPAQTNPISPSYNRRLNTSDVEIIEEIDKTGLKKYKDNFLFRVFPKLKQAKVAKEILKKIGDLNIDTNNLLEKSVPYGENDSRYENLVRYINAVNEANIKK